MTEKLRDILVTDRSPADVRAGNGKGTYNAEDLNRVLRACSWLAGKLGGYGYSVAGEYFPACLAWARAEPPEGGTVKSDLRYRGETAEVRAIPAAEFEFKGWREAGETVSESPVYQFTAQGDRELLAVFEALSNVTRFIPAGETDGLVAADGQEFFVVR